MDKEQICTLCGLSTQTYNMLLTKGVIDTTADAITTLASIARYYKSGDDLKRDKMDLERENIAAKREYMNRMVSASDSEDTMHPILRAEKLQKIRLDKAKEFEVWTKVKALKEGVLNSFELTRLLTPFLQTIKSSLNQMATNEPSLQPAIDRCLKSLADFGESMIMSANEDLDDWVKSQSEGDLEADLTDIDKILLGVKE